MSILFDRLRKNQALEEIKMEETCFSFGRSEGAPYLFFKDEELQDLMGHEIKYYPNGVLLIFKENLKEHSNENSFMFFNNEGKQVFELSNIKYRRYEPREKPTTSLSVIVREGFLHVIETNNKTKQQDEYFIHVKTGNKITDVFEKKEDVNNCSI